MIGKERLVSLLVGAAFGFLGGFVASALHPSTNVVAQQTPEVVRAQSFEVVDNAGQTLAKLGFSNCSDRSYLGNNQYCGDLRLYSRLWSGESANQRRDTRVSELSNDRISFFSETPQDSTWVSAGIKDYPVALDKNGKVRKPGPGPYILVRNGRGEVVWQAP